MEQNRHLEEHIYEEVDGPEHIYESIDNIEGHLATKPSLSTAQKCKEQRGIQPTLFGGKSVRSDFMSNKADSKSQRMKVQRESLPNLQAAYSSGDKSLSTSEQKPLHPKRGKKGRKDHSKVKYAAEMSNVKQVIQEEIKAAAESAHSKHHLQKCQGLDQNQISLHAKRNPHKGELKHSGLNFEVQCTVKGASSPMLIRDEGVVKAACDDKEAKVSMMQNLETISTSSAPVPKRKPVLPVSHEHHHSPGDRKKALLANLLARNFKMKNKRYHWEKNKSKSCDLLLDSKTKEVIKDGELNDGECPNVPPRLYLLDPEFAGEIVHTGITGLYGSQGRSSGQASPIGTTAYTIHHSIKPSIVRAHSIPKICVPCEVSTSDDNDAGQEEYMEVKRAETKGDSASNALSRNRPEMGEKGRLVEIGKSSDVCSTACGNEEESNDRLGKSSIGLEVKVNACDSMRGKKSDLNTQLRAKLENLLVLKSQENLTEEKRVRYI